VSLKKRVHPPADSGIFVALQTGVSSPMSQEATMRMKTLMVVAALAACALAVPTAEAAITPTLIAVTPNGDGTFTYTYNVDLAEDQNAMNDGAFPTGTTPTGPGDPGAAFQDYFTIYDFAGLIDATSSTQPAGWTFSFALTGPSGSTVGPADDPGLINVYWVRTGEDLTGPQDLGNFSVRSAFGLVALDNYTSDATRSQGPTAGTAVASIGSTNVPQAQGGNPFQVSEPGTLMLLGSGLLGLGLFRRKKN
jgi:hypothetical protein